MGDLSERKYKVLIVDDSETNRAILNEILSGEYIIAKADSGEKAVEILKRDQGEISLVLLDVIMPEMDGYDVLEQMNRLGIIDDVPVIMISAESSPGFITRAYDLGAADYVSRLLRLPWSSVAHVIHINIITELLLKQLMKKSSKYDLSMTDIRLISTASSLHDIGKIAIPDEILNKPGRFTPQEYEIMKTHSEIGASMLKNLSEYQNAPLMKAS